MITLSHVLLKTFTFINRFLDKSISRQQAAKLLGLSTRQITRLKKGVLTSGAESWFIKILEEHLLFQVKLNNKK